MKPQHDPRTRCARRFRTKAFATVTAAVALTACSSTSAGTAAMPGIAKDYSGPAISAQDPKTATMFTPGVQVKIGNANRSVTCTVGWWLVSPDGNVFLTSAGQCGLPGDGMPVRFSFMPENRAKWEKPDTRRVANVVKTSFQEPFNPANPNIAVFQWIFEGNDDIPVSMLPGNRINATAVPIGDAQQWAEDNGGQEVCWLTNTAFPSLSPGELHCGLVSNGANGKIAVTRAPKDALKPEDAGAPVFWRDSRGQYHPLGIATEDRDGRVIVDTLDRLLDSIRENGRAEFKLFLAPGDAPR